MLMLLVSVSAFSQTVTGVITGRAEDSSGALIPGVEVTIASPAMIIGSGTRMGITNEQGSYRFTQLPAPGTYTVTFSLPGFRTLNIEGVNVAGGAAVTINGTLEVATVAETITVTSQAPTIDLEEATTVVNWSQKLLDELPYGRSVRALSRLNRASWSRTLTSAATRPADRLVSAPRCTAGGAAMKSTTKA